MRKPFSIIIFFVVIYFTITSVSDAKCPGEWLGDMLDYENPRVIQYLREIEGEGSGFKTNGIILCDGNVIFKNWIFQKAIHNSSLGQHTYIFQDDETLKAVSWVEEDGHPLDIPLCPYGERCMKMMEGAIVISGDIYTWKRVQPGHGIVIIIYPTNDWINDLTNH